MLIVARSGRRCGQAVAGAAHIAAAGGGREKQLRPHPRAAPPLPRAHTGKAPGEAAARL